jgi:hypothetical protein
MTSVTTEIETCRRSAACGGGRSLGLDDLYGLVDGVLNVVEHRSALRSMVRVVRIC